MQAEALVPQPAFGILGYYLRIILKVCDRSLAVLSVLTFTLGVLF